MIRKEFLKNLEKLNVPVEGDVAVAVSGGADSMALAYCLCHYTDLRVHVLSVDHGLRPEAAQEVLFVGEAVKSWGAEFSPLVWEHDGVGSRLHEMARSARYDLMRKYCGEHEITLLFVGHHMDDQAETFLFRLAKGSGLDGLGGMKGVQDLGGLRLIRPFLNISKGQIVKFCEEKGIDFVDDPSNRNMDFARPRIRAVLEALAQEGMNTKRLARTAERIERGSRALEAISGKSYDEILIYNDATRIEFNLPLFLEMEEEIALRCLIKGTDGLRVRHDYGVRMEKVERLFQDLRSSVMFRKRTLGGVIFEKDEDAGMIILCKEDKNPHK